MKILVIGIPGSGKTTVSQYISKKYNLCFVKTGEILRQLIKQDQIHTSVKEALEKGEYADDSLIGDVVRERVSKKDCQFGFVMDGYPRRLSQLDVYNPGFDVVIYLGISEPEAIKRLLARGREDDKESIINRRLEVHRENMDELLSYLEDTGKLSRVNAEQPLEDVYKIVDEIIKEKNETKN